MEQAPQPPEFETLLNFFKALGNESRLKIIGLLAERERTVGEMAQLLGVKEPTVSQHLDMLKYVGLVKVRPEGNFRYYSLDSQALIGMNKDVFSREGLASIVSDAVESGDEFERKVFKTFCDGERIVRLPTSEKKFLVLLRWLASQFEYGVQYPEKQVNEIIKRHHEDYALLRREMVDWGLMRREKGIYWRVPPETTEA
ncbi:MAG: metalloregulator ArsR/SmtB family transcription factor [Chloroflexi bacterium]|nr:metalloregulator ArsR/SmtB family transcription factor [Chloroflexota bacterium]